MTPTYFHRYTLKARDRLNAVTGQTEFAGALIRRGDGVGCLHPWEALGDASLEAELSALRSGQPLALGERALECAREDGRARRGEYSLFRGLDLPRCHATLTRPSEEAFEEAWAQGFSRFKVKARPDQQQLDLALAGISRLPPEARIRFDFNEEGNVHFLTLWLSRLSREQKARIEFLEDPFPYEDPRDWREFHGRMRIPLALDQHLRDAVRGESQVGVIKPAVENPPKILAQHPQIQDWVVTSYMDHPVGQAYAAWWAAHLDQSYEWGETFHGLATHQLFEPTPFSEELHMMGDRLIPPKGTGLGFNELLDKLPWKLL
ncbi:MAG: enolase C-terminal domain-like protein [Verrucomicrobiota bacterium]